MKTTHKRIIIALVLVVITVVVLILTMSNFGDSLENTIKQMG